MMMKNEAWAFSLLLGVSPLCLADQLQTGGSNGIIATDEAFWGVRCEVQRGNRRLLYGLPYLRDQGGESGLIPARRKKGRTFHQNKYYKNSTYVFCVAFRAKGQKANVKFLLWFGAGVWAAALVCKGCTLPSLSAERPLPGI
jgi:hypothetical protein